MWRAVWISSGERGFQLSFIQLHSGVRISGKKTEEKAKLSTILNWRGKEAAGALLARKYKRGRVIRSGVGSDEHCLAGLKGG